MVKQQILNKVLQTLSEYNGTMLKDYKEGDWNRRMNFQYMGTYWYEFGRLRLETHNFKNIEVYIDKELIASFDDNEGKQIYYAVNEAINRLTNNKIDKFLTE